MHSAKRTRRTDGTIALDDICTEISGWRQTVDRR
jgi:hypothetical protein